MTRRRAPRPFSVAIERLRHDLAPPGLLSDVQRVWPGVVGAVVAAEATPTAERAGVMTIACSSSVWAAELEMMSADVVARLNDALLSLRDSPADAPSVTELRCRVRGSDRSAEGGRRH